MKSIYAIIALTLSIITILAPFPLWLEIPLYFISLILGIIALVLIKKSPETGGKVFAIIAIILSTIGIIIAIGALIYFGNNDPKTIMTNMRENNNVPNSNNLEDVRVIMAANKAKCQEACNSEPNLLSVDVSTMNSKISCTCYYANNIIKNYNITN